MPNIKNKIIIHDARYAPGNARARVATLHTATHKMPVCTPLRLGTLMVKCTPLAP